ncbi:MAG: pyridoxal-phosphate dependent enzyme [Bacteroidia bacterium]|nr:pyridoxal-phosphate dependent enzyme [Bacteroidia bacterium]MCO5252794.1 pyridoxal-phosphate dependent enzyme [Bacteroidota bacterium]
MFNLPSPLQKIERQDFSQKGISVYVKRDDLIHAFVSGNKLRKLKGWLKVAQEKQSHTLVTFGGAYSNHLIASAYAATIFGYKSIGIVRGDEQPDNLVLKHCKLFGMELFYVNRESYRDKETCFESLFGKHDGYLYIPEGGGGLPGRFGFEEFLQEPNMSADHYVLAAGTGTSAKGIADALFKQNNNQSKVWALACVKDKSLSELAANNLTFSFEYAGKGFGKFDHEHIDVAQNEFRQTGILFDPVYTTKAWMGLLDLVKNNTFKEGEKIIFVHTGGLTGWWSL